MRKDNNAAPFWSYLRVMTVTTEPIEEMVGGIYQAMRQGSIRNLLESLSREFEPGLEVPSHMPSRLVRLTD